MKKYIFSALCAIAITSCSTQKTAMDIKGTWNIEKAMGKSTVGAETAPFIQFENDGKMYGNASVNRFFGNYRSKYGHRGCSKASHRPLQHYQGRRLQGLHLR